MEQKFDITNPWYNEPIFLVPWLSGSTVGKKDRQSTKMIKIKRIWRQKKKKKNEYQLKVCIVVLQSSRLSVIVSAGADTAQNRPVTS